MTEEQKPSVSRHMWYWTGANEPHRMNVFDPEQAFDAVVAFVHEDGTVNVTVTDHAGVDHIRLGVPHAPLGTGVHDGYTGCVTWMPYQAKAADLVARLNKHPDSNVHGIGP